MNNYKIITFQSDERKLVLSTSYVSPLSSVFIISSELANESYQGEVLFDLLLSNGFSPNRFLSMQFDGTKFLPQTTKKVEKISKELLKEIYAFYYEHTEYVEQSSLPDVQKHLLKNNQIANNLVSC